MAPKPLRYLSRPLTRLWRQRFKSGIGSLLPTLWIVGLITAAIALWGFAEIADEIFDAETLALDQAILLSIYRIHTQWLSLAMIGITTVGGPSALFGLTVIFCIVLLLKRYWMDAIIGFIAVGGGIALNNWLKTLFQRSRPELWERIVNVDFYSFPSGHAMTALIVYGFFGYWLATRSRLPRGLTLSITVLLILLVGFSRLYLGVHWPTDVIAGYAAGLVWLIACLLSLDIWTRRQAVRQARQKANQQ